MTITLREAALAYAEAGWPVFQLKIRGKEPAVPTPHPGVACRGECGMLGHGVLDATCDLELIDRWWTINPDRNIGLATGTPGPDVVDFDVSGGKPGKQSMLKLARLLSGAFARIRTNSGGYHFYFVGSDQRNGTMKQHGVDFRSRGGYVVADPSHTDQGRWEILEWMDGGKTVSWNEIRHLLTFDPARPPLAIAQARRSRRGARDAAPTDFATLVDYMERQTEGSRNDQLIWALCQALRNGASDAVLNQIGRAAIRAGLTPTEVDASTRSARRMVSG